MLFNDNGLYLSRAAGGRGWAQGGSILLALVLLAGCSGETREAASGGPVFGDRPPSSVPEVYVDADGSHASAVRDTLHNAFPHLRFTDGAISLNDRCPVRKVPLNRRLPALFVNGRPLGFC